MKMKDTEKIDDFAGRLSEVSTKSASLGTNIEMPKLVKKFLNSLPRKKYIHLIAALEQVLDVNTLGFEDIVGRLKVYEERTCDEDDQGKLMLRTLKINRTQTVGEVVDPTEGEEDEVVMEDIVIDLKLLKLQETQESENGDTQQADALMMHELVYINEKNVQRKALEENSDFKDMWYLDNGASNHMTGNLEYFSKIDKTVTGKVRFGDDSRIDIKGKGSIPFVSKNGDSKLLEDVYYIPDLRSNIISLGQATEAGCDVRMRKGYLTLFDREGELLIWANRARNRLYKVTLEVKQNKCLQLSMSSDSMNWHDRMGHIGFDNMKTVINKELVIRIPKLIVEKQTCTSCLLGKQVRQSFPQSTSYRASNPLELVHGDLCGPITPPTTANKSFGVFGNKGIRDESVDQEAEKDEEDKNDHEDIQEDSALDGNVIVPIQEEIPMLRRSERQTRPPTYLKDYILLSELEGERLRLAIDEEPWDFSEAMELKEWREACREEISSIEKNRTWNLVNRPPQAKAIGLKWVFKLKRNSDGTINKYKARLVAKGYVQKHGVDYDEVFALEEVYVVQPEGFIVEGKEDQVYKLNKALYGLKQAPRAWNHKLNQILMELKFVKCSKEPSLYRKGENEDLLIVAVYVDDLLVTRSSLRMILEFKKEVSTKFEMSDLGRLTYYLGIEVLQHENGIILSQERYVNKILEETKMDGCNAVHIPMCANLKLSKAKEEASIDEK
ncbi:Hypothetical protein T32B20.i [Arabidopsis thaliana]|uniref:Uncharacterized protein T32B20.i n=1 Tax=Arabidopsis thaliana TaxID=3702 RepID=Q9LKT8_ARATH|nr:Hypothetical protein T32B20.i [Arabidopsis thaliana]